MKINKNYLVNLIKEVLNEVDPQKGPSNEKSYQELINNFNKFMSPLVSMEKLLTKMGNVDTYKQAAERSGISGEWLTDFLEVDKQITIKTDAFVKNPVEVLGTLFKEIRTQAANNLRSILSQRGMDEGQISEAVKAVDEDLQNLFKSPEDKLEKHKKKARKTKSYTPPLDIKLPKNKTRN